MPRVISESAFPAFIDGKVYRNARRKLYGHNVTNPLARCKNDIVTVTMTFAPVVRGRRVSTCRLHAQGGRQAGMRGPLWVKRCLPPLLRQAQAAPDQR